jgi:hypothetical protein
MSVSAKRTEQKKKISGRIKKQSLKNYASLLLNFQLKFADQLSTLFSQCIALLFYSSVQAPLIFFMNKGFRTCFAVNDSPSLLDTMALDGMAYGNQLR